MTEIEHLDQLCASRLTPGQPRTPIRLGGTHQFPVDCKPMASEWKSSLSTGRFHWYTGNPSYRQPFAMSQGRSSQPGLWDLAEALVRLGGEQSCMPAIEEDLEKIMARGQLWRGHGPMMKGSPGRCHSNACYLWEQNQDKLMIATGYALSDDGLWRQHSWCVFPKARSVQIIETTVHRELYFGFVLTLDETVQFCTDNIDGVTLAPGTTARYRPEGEIEDSPAPLQRERAFG